MLCNDTLYFNSSSYYAKKKFILSTKNCYNDILSISNNYLNDVVFYVKPFTNKNIINKYNLEYNKTKLSENSKLLIYSTLLENIAFTND